MAVTFLNKEDYSYKITTDILDQITEDSEVAISGDEVIEDAETSAKARIVDACSTRFVVCQRRSMRRCDAALAWRERA